MGKSVALYYSEGRSDKVYQVEIAPAGDGYVVNFRHGRRGAALKTGAKTSAPVSLGDAESIFAKLVAAKKAKGYTEEQSGQAYQDTAEAGRVSGVLPQLLNAVAADELDALVEDSRWMAQVKYDGERRLIHIQGDQVTGINRRGLVVPLAQEIVDAVRAIGEAHDEALLDGEDMGDHFVVFDLLTCTGESLSGRGAYERYALLENIVGTLACVDGPLRLASIAVSSADKRFILETTARTGGEGVVFKDVHGTYEPGRPNSGGPALKFKFCAEATVRVAAVTPGKRSVAMEVLDADGDWEAIGSVTVPANAKVPEVGARIDVRYLYAFRGGSLFQPVFKGVRNDLEDTDCTMSQLTYKGEARAEAA